MNLIEELSSVLGQSSHVTQCFLRTKDFVPRHAIQFTPPPLHCHTYNFCFILFIYLFIFSMRGRRRQVCDQHSCCCCCCWCCCCCCCSSSSSSSSSSPSSSSWHILVNLASVFNNRSSIRERERATKHKRNYIMICTRSCKDEPLVRFSYLNLKFLTRE